jgi:hypothetical protein
VEDLEGALKKQNLTLQPGDAVVIHTGWGKLYGKDNPRYVKILPGHRVPAALWLAVKDPMLLGADNWPVEVAPNPDKATVAAGAPDRARGERHSPPREPQARRARAEGRGRIRIRDAAAEDSGRLRLHGIADRGEVAAALSAVQQDSLQASGLRGVCVGFLTCL